MTKSCAWGICPNTDNKNPTLRFISFVKPYGRYGDRARAANWVYLCGRKNFTLENITQNSYICAHHFPNHKNKAKLNPILNKELEPYSCLSSEVHPKFVPTIGNTGKLQIIFFLSRNIHANSGRVTIFGLGRQNSGYLYLSKKLLFEGPNHLLI